MFTSALPSERRFERSSVYKTSSDFQNKQFLFQNLQKVKVEGIWAIVIWKNCLSLQTDMIFCTIH